MKTVYGGIVVIAAAAAAALSLPGHHAPATPAPPAHRPACVTFDVTGRAIGPGMQWDEPVTFCGRGLPPGTWTCPAPSPALDPGTRLACEP